jgi:hypothetical protein
MSDKERALESLKKIAKKKLKPQSDKIQKKATKSLKDLGLDNEMMKYALGTLGAIEKGEIEGGIKLNKNLELKGKVSPREKAIKLLYNKGF